ncbi:metal-dependent hydrolase [Natrialbaceae archaeon AArc-T1-2]|uniref:metal-dependent hydrolase n=1 Tax=Natrialbaceae archaeon AArc-T1-2 TaxID=3053904 RepID=UPI00255A8CFB|nr:metal-dependent hydrolase [Natrialbaceae archaeon AArc-T1-2]WIV66338.1 metal-dependent hydrolase [Natrialbaceae archaeon AArc-T1-2]
MQPVVHPIVGYLCYAAYTRASRGDAPAGEPALVAVVAATIPDVVDQPLWLASATPVGRTIAHSLLFAVPVVVAVWLLSRRRGRPTLGVAFAVGYLSHVATDVPWHVLAGDYDELGFLLWPLTQMPQYSGVKPLGTVAGLEITTLWLEAVIAVAGIALWWHDGRPGLETIRSWL